MYASKSASKTADISLLMGGVEVLHMQPEGRYLIHLLTAALKGTQPENPPDELDWVRLYKLGVWHGISNTVCYAVNRITCGSKPPQVILAKFQRDCKIAAAREAAQHIAVEKILESFEEKGIACMPLKGCLIKYLYPQPDMRLMADIDIYYKTGQAEEIKKVMQEQGYVLKSQGVNHDIYYRQPYVSIEMHHRLISENSPYSDYLSNTWDRSRLKTGCRYTYELSLEDFYIYLLIHLTKHYNNGGTGIRSFLDIWVYINRYKGEMDWAYIRGELSKTNLSVFAENIIGLCEVWFGNAKSNELYDEMAEYVFVSGAYGIGKHSVLSSMNAGESSKKSFRAAKLLYRIKLFFPGLKHMKILYPFLGMMPFLLPACWLLRGVKSILLKHEHTVSVLNNVSSVTAKDVERIRNLHKKAGL